MEKNHVFLSEEEQRTDYFFIHRLSHKYKFKIDRPYYSRVLRPVVAVNSNVYGFLEEIIEYLLRTYEIFSETQKYEDVEAMHSLMEEEEYRWYISKNKLLVDNWLNMFTVVLELAPYTKKDIVSDLRNFETATILKYRKRGGFLDSDYKSVTLADVYTKDMDTQARKRFCRDFEALLYNIVVKWEENFKS